MRVRSASNHKHQSPESPKGQGSLGPDEESKLPLPPLITHVGGSAAPAENQGADQPRSSSPSRSSVLFNKRATISSLFSLTGGSHHNDTNNNQNNDNPSRVASPENSDNSPTTGQHTASPATSTANAEPEVKLRTKNTNRASSTNRLSSIISPFRPTSRPMSTMVPNENRTAENTKSSPRGRSTTPSLKRNTLDFSGLTGSGEGSGLGAALGLGKWSRSKTAENSSSMRAWIVDTRNPETPRPYDYKPLIEGAPVHELWDNGGDTFVNLFPPNSGHTPSFRVDSAIFASSHPLSCLAGRIPKENGDKNSPSPRTEQDQDARSDNSTNTRDAADLEESSIMEFQLNLPVPLSGDIDEGVLALTEEDIDMLILFRNFFAFLVGQGLVATPRFPTLLDIFLEINGLLTRFQFTNLDGSTFGETATSSFSSYCNELDLYDVRNNPDKIIQAIVLGETLHFVPLYEQGFTHAVGYFKDIRSEAPRTYNRVSSTSRLRIERAGMDLDGRVRTAAEKLNDFDFPSMFAGIANSTMQNEFGLIKFKNWKAATMAMRRHVMHYYRKRFGSWPPKVKSKHSRALNRLVIRELYQDMCDMYDLMVDRTSMSTRDTDMTTALNDKSANTEENVARALRQIMSELDRSTPPVLPAIPYDIPRLPMPVRPHKQTKRATIRAALTFNKRRELKQEDSNEILFASYNTKEIKPSPFVGEFMKFERRCAAGKTAEELVDLRCGQWLFIYAVLQSCPMLVVDAPDVKFTEDVDYFLCIPPRGSAPWMKEDPKAGNSWFGVEHGNGVVNLPKHLVEHSVAGIYRRSYCWKVGMKWAEEAKANDPEANKEEEPLEDEEQLEQTSNADFAPRLPHVSQQNSVGGYEGMDSMMSFPHPPQIASLDRRKSMPTNPSYYNEQGIDPYQMHIGQQQSGHPHYPLPSQLQQSTTASYPRSTASSTGSSSGHAGVGANGSGHHPHSSVDSRSPNSSQNASLPFRGQYPYQTDSYHNSQSSLNDFGGLPTTAPPFVPQVQPLHNQSQMPHHASASLSSSSLSGTSRQQASTSTTTVQLRPRDRGQSTATAHRSSLYMGIEALPLPQGVSPVDTASNRRSTYNPNMSFDNILSTMPDTRKKRRW